MRLYPALRRGLPRTPVGALRPLRPLREKNFPTPHSPIRAYASLPRPASGPQSRESVSRECGDAGPLHHSPLPNNQSLITNP